MPGINSYEKSGKSSDFLREQAFIAKTQQQIAESLGTGKSAVVAMKNHNRGASVEVAKKAAAVTGAAPATIFLTTQVASLQKRIATKAIRDENILGACQSIMKGINGSFRDSEFDRRDEEFIAAAENLKKIAVAALDLADNTDASMGGKAATREYTEPTNATGDDVSVALKSRDAHGRNVTEGKPIERDAFGRVI